MWGRRLRLLQNKTQSKRGTCLMVKQSKYIKLWQKHCKAPCYPGSSDVLILNYIACLYVPCILSFSCLPPTLIGLFEALRTITTPKIRITSETQVKWHEREEMDVVSPFHFRLNLNKYNNFRFLTFIYITAMVTSAGLRCCHSLRVVRC